jgi:hypothetical protein
MNFILFFIEWKLEILNIIKPHGCMFLHSHVLQPVENVTDHIFCENIANRTV